MIKKFPIIQLFNQHIKNTPAKSIVSDKTLLFCYLTYAVCKAGNFSSLKIYVTSRMLKHLYDKKPAEEFDFIINNLYKIARYPDHLYQNLGSKRGNICLLKKIKKEFYFCTLESIEKKGKSVPVGNYIATCFRLRENKKNNYLKNYKLLWSWKDGKSSS